MDTKEKVLKKASSMFQPLGIKYVTMDSLASAVGISKRTIYELFEDKDDLVIQSLGYMLQEDNKRLLKIIEETDDVVQAFFKILKEQEERRKEFSEVFVEEIKRYFSTVSSKFFSCKEDLKKFSASYVLLERGIKQKIFNSDLKIELVDTFIHEMMTIIHVSERIKVLEPSEGDIFLNIVLPYFRGLCTMKGINLIESYFEEQKKNNLYEDDKS